MPNECPSRDELSGLILGTLTEARADSVSEHVEQCPACEETILNLEETADSVVEKLRQPDAQDPFTVESGCQRVVELVEAIGRDPSFSMVGGEAAPAPDAEELGTIRSYRLLAKLGQGGMGSVYKALHVDLDKVVALKVLPQDRLSDEAAVARFRREMKAVGKLNHPNIVQATDAGEEDGMHYLVMELVDGIDLARLVKQRGPLPVAEACELIRQAALGLQHAHEHSLVHRDIKPSNLMLAEGQGARVKGQETDGTSPLALGSQPLTLKILDMGLALLDAGHVETASDLTGTGQIMGTIDYMAPEQGSDTHNVDIRADVYSLGATLYKLLTGRAPFEGERYNSPIRKLTALANTEPERVDAIREDLPGELADLVQRMLSKSPEGRPATPSEVAHELTPFAESADLGRLIQPEDSRTDVTEAIAQEDRTTDPTCIAETNEDVRRGDVVRRGSPDAAVAPTEGLQPTSGKPAVAGVARSEDHATTGATGRNPVFSKNRVSVLRALSGIAAVVLLGVMVFKFATRDGTLFVELDAAYDIARVEVDDNEVSWERVDNARRLRFQVDPGERRVRMFLGDGTEIITEATETPIEIAAGGEQTIRAWLEPDEPRPQGSGLADVAAQGVSTDLLQQIDLTRDTISGDWTLEDGVLTGINDFAGAAESSLLHIPVEVPDEYIIDAIVERVGPPQRGRRGGLTLVAPVGDSDVKVVIDGWQATISGLNLVDGRLAGLNPTRYNGTVLPAEERVHLRYTVGRSGILVTADGETIIDWAGQPDQLSATEGQLRDRIREQDGLGLSLGSRSEFRIEQLTLTPIAPPPGSTAPAGNFALRFDGEDDFVSLPTMEHNARHPMTLEAFVVSDPPRQGRTPTILSSRHQSLAYLSGKLRFTWATLDGEYGKEAVISEYGLAHSTRHHVAVVFDGREIRLFSNGSQSGARVADAWPASLRTVPTSIGANSLFRADGGLEYIRAAFAGQIDEVRISRIARYSEDFTPTERFEADEHTLALYHFDEGEGDVLVDSSGNGHHGTIHGATWVRIDRDYTVDRQIAEWVRSIGGKVTDLIGKELISDAAELPPGEFQLVGVAFSGIKDFQDADLEQLQSARNLQRIQFERTLISDATLEYIGQLTQLRYFKVALGGPITDEGLSHLQGLQQLETLVFNDTEITDAGLEYLAPLSSLRNLWLANTGVTGDGLADLAALPELAYLYLPNCALTDSGLEHLRNLRLRMLVVTDTNVTAAGVARLQEARPNLHISWDGNADQYPASELADDEWGGETRANFALQFDGEDDYVEIPVEYGDADSPLTVEAYVVPSTVGERPYAAVSNARFWIRHGPHPYPPYEGRPIWEAIGKARDGSRALGIASQNSVQRDEIVHLAGVWDGEELTLFVDGVRQTSRALPGGLMAGGQGFLIGAVPPRADLQAIHNHFAGLIDEVRISNTARYTEDFTPEERFEPDEHTLALYHFDEGEGDVLIDSSGNGHHGAIHGATWVRAKKSINSSAEREIAEWVISIGGSIVVRGDAGEIAVAEIATLPNDDFQVVQIELGWNDAVTDSDLERLAELSDLWLLRLTNTSLSDAGLEYIGQIPSLHVLYISGTEITDEGLSHLKFHPNLVTVSVFGTSIGDSGLENLASLPNIDLLHLAGTQITDDGLAHLRDTNIRILNLQMTSVTGDGFGHLESVSQMAWSGPFVSDAALAHLQQLNSLNQLTLPEPKITDAGIEHLAALTQLNHLDLKRTQVTADGISRLREALPNCSITSDFGTFGPIDYATERQAAEWIISRGGSVDVMTDERQDGIDSTERLPSVPFTVVGVALNSDLELTDDDLSRLSGLASVGSISLHNCRQVTDAGLMHLRELRGLKILDLGGTYDHSATRVTDHGMAVLLDGAPALIKLSLQGVAITDEGLAHLSEKETLEVLHLIETEITDDGLQWLQQLPNLAGLRLPTQITDTGLAHLEPIERLNYIDLAGCTKIGEAGMRSLTRLPRLHEIRLQNTALTDADILPLADSTSLRIIRLEGTNVTHSGVARLREALPMCQITIDEPTEQAQ